MDYLEYNIQSSDSSHNDHLQSTLEFLKNGQTDLSFITEDGQRIETRKSLICLYSRTVSAYLSGIPCCSKYACISLPVSSFAINNLLKVLANGFYITDSIDHEELSDVIEVAMILGIVFQNIDFVSENDEKNLEHDENSSVNNNTNEDSIKDDKINPEKYYPKLNEAYNENKSDIGKNNVIKNKTKNKDKLKKNNMKFKEEAFAVTEVPVEPLLQEVDGVPKSKNMKKVAKDKHTCSQCGKMFIKLYLLNRHIRTHSAEKPFACSQCGKFFSRREYISIHAKLVHTGGLKLYKCNICTKSFKTESYMKTHERNHNCVEKFNEEGNIWNLWSKQRVKKHCTS